MDDKLTDLGVRSLTAFGEWLEALPPGATAEAVIAGVQDCNLRLYLRAQGDLFLEALAAAAALADAPASAPH